MGSVGQDVRLVLLLAESEFSYRRICALVVDRRSAAPRPRPDLSTACAWEKWT